MSWLSRRIDLGSAVDVAVSQAAATSMRQRVSLCRQWTCADRRHFNVEPVGAPPRQSLRDELTEPIPGSNL